MIVNGGLPGLAVLGAAQKESAIGSEVGYRPSASGNTLRPAITLCTLRLHNRYVGHNSDGVEDIFLVVFLRLLPVTMTTLSSPLCDVCVFAVHSFRLRLRRVALNALLF